MGVKISYFRNESIDLLEKSRCRRLWRIEVARLKSTWIAPAKALQLLVKSSSIDG